MVGESVTIRTEKASFDVPHDNAAALVAQLRERKKGQPAADALERAMEQTRALYAPTFEQKRELYGALREWLLVGTTEDVGSELMDLMTEIETTDLRGKL